MRVGGGFERAVCVVTAVLHDWGGLITLVEPAHRHLRFDVGQLSLCEGRLWRIGRAFNLRLLVIVVANYGEPSNLVGLALLQLRHHRWLVCPARLVRLCRISIPRGQEVWANSDRCQRTRSRHAILGALGVIAAGGWQLFKPVLDLLVRIF